MHRLLSRLMVAFLAILFILTLVTVTRSPATPAQAAGFNFTPASPAIGDVVKVESTCAASNQVLTVNVGTFVSGSGGVNTPINMTVAASGLQANCISAGAFTVYYLCPNTAVTTATFTLSGSSTPGILTCGSVSSGTGEIFLNAYPNVLPCTGGSTTITAYTHFQPPLVPTVPGGTNGLPLPQQPYFFFKTDTGLIQQTSNNTAILTLLQGMSSTTVTAYTGALTPGSTGTITVQLFCPAVTPTVAVTPGPLVTPIPLPQGSLTLVASPPSLDTCDGSIFVSATVKDSAGKLVPDNTNVLFLATRGILDPASANTILGTATIVYTADLTTSGSVRLSAQSGTAFASVVVPVTCGPSGGSFGVTGSSTSGSLGQSVNGTPSAGAARPGGMPTFLPPNTGETGQASSVRIQPPNTGDAGLRPSDDAASPDAMTVSLDAASSLIAGQPCS